MGHQVRRSEHLFFSCHDGRVPDIAALLSGTVRLSSVRQIFAISVLTSEEQLIGEEGLLALLNIPSNEWTASEVLMDRGDLTQDALDRFTRQGILICDDPGEPFRTLRSQDEALSETPWSRTAALYHSAKKWRDVRTAPLEDRQGTVVVHDLTAEYGPPPSHFHALPGLLTRQLSSGERSGGLYDALWARRTIRMLDRETRLSAEDLAVILRHVFGCQGYSDLSDALWLLKKSSPSGGALHPIEVYPLLRRVDGFEPGLYHYSVEHHALTALRLMSEEEVTQTALLFAAGQEYARNAQALFIMTARFPRSFWKYRRHEKAYSVILMDAGHLSQTFYLVCTELGLGPFVTAAINDRNIEEMLGIDGFEEGAIAVLGVGHPARGDDGLDPEFKPYVPGQSST